MIQRRARSAITGCTVSDFNANLRFIFNHLPKNSPESRPSSCYHFGHDCTLQPTRLRPLNHRQPSAANKRRTKSKNEDRK